jgi:hypothetical protein
MVRKSTRIILHPLSEEEALRRILQVPKPGKQTSVSTITTGGETRPLTPIDLDACTLWLHPGGRMLYCIPNDADESGEMTTGITIAIPEEANGTFFKDFLTDHCARLVPRWEDEEG